MGLSTLGLKSSRQDISGTERSVDNLGGKDVTRGRQSVRPTAAYMLRTIYLHENAAVVEQVATPVGSLEAVAVDVRQGELRSGPR